MRCKSLHVTAVPVLRKYSFVDCLNGNSVQRRTKVNSFWFECMWRVLDYAVFADKVSNRWELGTGDILLVAVTVPFDAQMHSMQIYQSGAHDKWNLLYKRTGLGPWVGGRGFSCGRAPHALLRWTHPEQEFHQGLHAPVDWRCGLHISGRASQRSGQQVEKQSRHRWFCCLLGRRWDRGGKS